MITDTASVSPAILPRRLRDRVPPGRGRWLVTDGEPPCGSIIGRLVSGETVQLVDCEGQDVDGVDLYTGWAVVSDRLPGLAHARHVTRVRS